MILLDLSPTNEVPTATGTSQELSYVEDASAVTIDPIVITEVDTIQASTDTEGNDDVSSETVSVTLVWEMQMLEVSVQIRVRRDTDSSTGTWSISSVSLLWRIQH